MFEMLITGALFALGAAVVLLVCFLVGALVTWPFDLKAELKHTKDDLKYAREQVDKFYKFIRRENLESKFHSQQ
tara:strand:+ start:386 stop:607 length:222 start_codon:yes stop_codon:yes gene_type:complete